ncbi:MAG TPA: aldehyde dehydrogenase family protein [Acidobacteriaceae bacterium]
MNNAPKPASVFAASAACAGWGCTIATAASWATLPIGVRLGVLRRARHAMAARPEVFARAISTHLARTEADTLVTELLPLLAACKFLEKNAERLLRTRKLGLSGRPIWLGGVYAEVHHDPLGQVLIIGPANYPLFPPGVQVLQALAAGNHVTWKPGAGGREVAECMAEALREAGLPEGILRITEDTVEAAREALASGADKVIFTGSAETGRAVLRGLAETATPAVMELSGADAVVVLPRANLETVAKSLAFGLRLNGGAVCMSPRRLFAEANTMRALRPLLLRELEAIPPVELSAAMGASLRRLVDEAVASGASPTGEVDTAAQRPLLIEDATVGMAVTRADIFAPVLSLITLRSMLELPEAYAACSYGLTVSIFCAGNEERKARSLAHTLRAGTVLINDLIAPTVDPRVPFGGMGASGFGTTRGAEGLLEMTATKTLLVRRGGAMRHLQPTRHEDTSVFVHLIRVLHGRTWGERWLGLREVFKGRAALGNRNQ